MTIVKIAKMSEKLYNKYARTICYKKKCFTT